MAKRTKSSLATITKRVASRKKTTRKPARKPAAKKPNPQPVENPPFVDDLLKVVLPGAGAYAGSRIVGRIAYKVTKKKSTAFAKHAGAVAPAAFLGLVWLLMPRIERLKDYHGPAIIGASIGAIQSLLQTYLPQYGWILNDYHMDDVLPAQLAQQSASSPTEQGQIEIGGSDFDALPSGSSDDLDLADELGKGESVSDLYGGNFGGGLSGY